MKLSELPWLICPNKECVQLNSIIVEAKACIRIQDPNEETKYMIEEIYIDESCNCCCNSCGYNGKVFDFMRDKTKLIWKLEQ